MIGQKENRYIPFTEKECNLKPKIVGWCCGVVQEYDEESELVAMMIIVILEVIEEVMDVIKIMVDELAEGWFSPLCWGSGWISNHVVGNPPI